MMSRPHIRAVAGSGEDPDPTPRQESLDGFLLRKALGLNAVAHVQQLDPDWPAIPAEVDVRGVVELPTKRPLDASPEPDVDGVDLTAVLDAQSQASSTCCLPSPALTSRCRVPRPVGRVLTDLPHLSDRFLTSPR